MKTYRQTSLFELLDSDRNQKNYFEILLETLGVGNNLPGWTDKFGLALRQWMKIYLDAPIKTLSLFSGGGGLDIGFHDVGFNIIKMIEVDSRFAETLKVNFSSEGSYQEGEVICADIREFYPSDDLKVDMIIGGPPCQTFSAAGRRAAGVSGLDDPRGNLFREYVRILEKLKPKAFLYENVYGIIGAQKGRPWHEIVSAFRSIGYLISYRILDTADYGVPQHRERLIIVGTREKEFRFPRPTHGPDSLDQRPYYTAELAIAGVQDEKPGVVGGRYGQLLLDIPPGLNYSFYTEKMGHPQPLFAWRSKFSDFLYKADPELPVRTIKASGGQYTGPFHWENRPFSLSELKRLQTFPDSYTIAGGQLVAVEQIGNSVPPQFGRILALAVLEQVFGVNLPVEIDYLSSREELGFRTRKRLLNARYQEKAKEAISSLCKKQTLPSYPQISSSDNFRLEVKQSNNQTFTGYLSSEFLWCVQGQCDSDYPWNVEFLMVNKNQCLEFFVGKIGSDSNLVNSVMTLEITPKDGWVLPFAKVCLQINSLNRVLFTAAWKAFEYYLMTESIKADLVQLNGYYQYEPQMISKVIKFSKSSLETGTIHTWKALISVIEGRGVRQIIELEDLAKLWELTLDETVEALIEMRSLSYEIRSHYTNSQIPLKNILIPYSFPTLNPKSVQLRKNLFPEKFKK